jgi:hypothetical protein
VNMCAPIGRGARAISLVILPWTKCWRRVRAIVSTICIDAKPTRKRTGEAAGTPKVISEMYREALHNCGATCSVSVTHSPRDRSDASASRARATKETSSTSRTPSKPEGITDESFAVNADAPAQICAGRVRLQCSRDKSPAVEAAGNRSRRCVGAAALTAACMQTGLRGHRVEALMIVAKSEKQDHGGFAA